MSPSLPTAAPQPRNGSLPGSKDSELSTKYWATDLSEGSAFWREAQWAVDYRMWGYSVDGEYAYEGFDNSSISSGDFALMLYRMEHGGSHLR